MATFAKLTPDQRLLIIEGYIAGIPTDFAAPPRLPADTAAAVRRAKLILVQPELPDDVQLAERERWERHLDDLSEHDRDNALYQLAGFVQILNGVLTIESPEGGE